MEYNSSQIIKSDNFLSKEQKKYINDVLLSDDFPYYLNNHSVGKDGIIFLSHIVLHRPEFRNHPDDINSAHYNEIKDILDSFLFKNKINITKFLRISLNLTFNNGYKKTTIHQDHDCEHKQILIALNNMDSKSDTIIVDKKNKIHLKHKQYRGYCFGNKPHYNIIPSKGIRLMLVATFI